MKGPRRYMEITLLTIEIFDLGQQRTIIEMVVVRIRPEYFGEIQKGSMHSPSRLRRTIISRRSCRMPLYFFPIPMKTKLSDTSTIRYIYFIIERTRRHRSPNSSNSRCCRDQ